MIPALERGNRLRLDRAFVKREIKRGRATLADVIRDVPEECARARIGEMLTWPHRWGPHRRTALLREFVIARFGDECDIPRLVVHASTMPLFKATDSARAALALIVEEAELPARREAIA